MTIGKNLHKSIRCPELLDGCISEGLWQEYIDYLLTLKEPTPKRSPRKRKVCFVNKYDHEEEGVLLFKTNDRKGYIVLDSNKVKVYVLNKDIKKVLGFVRVNHETLTAVRWNREKRTKETDIINFD